MNNPMQLFQILMTSNNPMQMMSQMLGNNPMFKQAMSMSENKSPEQMAQTIKNLAGQLNIDDNQLKTMASRFGLNFPV